MELKRLLRHLRPSLKKDVFYDLGCGYGNLCIWISGRVSQAIGFESYFPRFRRAQLRVQKSGKTNVLVQRKNFVKVSFKSATIIYSTMWISSKTLRRIQRECKKGTRIILCYEPYPIKSEKFEEYYLMKVPFSRFKNETEFAKTCFEVNSIDEVYRKIKDKDAVKSLQRDISHAESNWKRIEQG